MSRIRRIAVVGLGQIGGSLVLALRKSRSSFHIKGIDIAPQRIRKLGNSLDSAGSDWTGSFDADLVVLCLHFSETMRFLQEAPRDLLIADTCSGKRKVLTYANRRRLRFVGTHPMAGNEREGERGWDAELFRDAPFFVCPGKYASRADVAAVRQIARLAGSRPVAVDASQHDRFVAVTSHVPALLAWQYTEFAAMIPSVFRGPGYRSFTRLAATPHTLRQTFIDSNAENILNVLRRWNAKSRLISPHYLRASVARKMRGRPEAGGL